MGGNMASGGGAGGFVRAARRLSAAHIAPIDIGPNRIECHSTIRLLCQQNSEICTEALIRRYCLPQVVKGGPAPLCVGLLLIFRQRVEV